MKPRESEPHKSNWRARWETPLSRSSQGVRRRRPCKGEGLGERGMQFETIDAARSAIPAEWTNRLTQRVFADLVAQRPDADAQGLGGASPVALPVGERTHDRVALERLQIERCRRIRRAEGLTDLGVEE